MAAMTSAHTSRRSRRRPIVLNYDGDPVLDAAFTAQPGLKTWDDTSWKNDEAASATFVYDDGSVLHLFVFEDDETARQHMSSRYTGHWYSAAEIDARLLASRLPVTDPTERLNAAYELLSEGKGELVESPSAAAVIREVEALRRGVIPNAPDWYFDGVSDLLEQLEHTEADDRFIDPAELEPSGEPVYRGSRVNWRSQSGYVVEVPVEKIAFMEGNIWNLSHAAALKERIERGDRPELLVPAARLYRIDADDVERTQRWDEEGELAYQMSMIEPWSDRDAGTFHVQLLDGNHRALAAMAVGEPTVFVTVGENYREDVLEHEWASPDLSANQGYTSRVSRRRTRRPRIRIAYEVWTEEDVEHGEPGERGWVDDEGHELDLDDADDSVVEQAVDFLRGEGATEPSSTAFHSGIWYTSYGEADFRTGERENRSYFLDDFTEEEEREIFDELR